MNFYLKILCLFYSVSTFSQNSGVGIFTNQPQAALDIDSNIYGVILPKISLQNKTDRVTVKNTNSTPNIIDGTIIWNTSNINNLISGFYIWNNNSWKRLLNQQTSIQNIATGLNKPNFEATTCDGATWTELTSNLGSTIIFNEDEIASASFFYNQPQNYICDIEVILAFKGKQTKSLEVFLKAPTGEIIELLVDDGPTIAIEGSFNSKFTSSSQNTLNNWNGTNKNFTLANVKPKGITTQSLLSSHFSKSSINSFSELTNKNPQGEWELIVNNRSSAYTMDVTDLKLRVKAREDHSSSGNYKLAKQIEFNNKNSKFIILHSIFEGQIKSDILHTVITKTHTPVVIDNTNNLNTLETKSINTKMNTGISWIQSHNQVIDNNLSENSTFYYQLWYKADIHENNTKHNITINNY